MPHSRQLRKLEITKKGVEILEPKKETI